MALFRVEHITKKEFAKFAQSPTEETTITGKYEKVEAATAEEAVQKVRQQFPNDWVSKRAIKITGAV